MFVAMSARDIERAESLVGEQGVEALWAQACKGCDVDEDPMGTMGEYLELLRERAEIPPQPKRRGNRRRSDSGGDYEPDLEDLALTEHGRSCGAHKRQGGKDGAGS